jgi:hypothetical protein
LTPLLLLFESHRHTWLNVEPLLRPALGEWGVPPVLNSEVE